MISKESFCKIADTLDEFFNGETFEAFSKLKIHESKLHEEMDIILGAIDADIDPKNKAAEDDEIPSGSFVCEWLFGSTRFNEICPNSASLYDYVVKAYESK